MSEFVRVRRDQLERWAFDMRYVSPINKELRAVLAQESGKVEPIGWRDPSVVWATVRGSNKARLEAEGKDLTSYSEPLYASPPAPVSVVPDNLLSHRNSWLQAMERLVELEPESGAPDEDEKGFWRRELKAMHDMYADLDRLNTPL